MDLAKVAATVCTLIMPKEQKSTVSAVHQTSMQTLKVKAVEIAQKAIIPLKDRHAAKGKMIAQSLSYSEWLQ
jgi:hypothetical protein